MRPTILQIEDEKNDVLLFNYALTRSDVDADLHVVHDGDQALSYLQGNAPYNDRLQHPLPTIVVVDLRMPKRNGFEVLEWIRSQPQFRDLPVYVLSSSSQQDDKHRAAHLGASGYFVKVTLFLTIIEELRSRILGAQQNVPEYGELLEHS